jgi:hypothetical protein
MCRRHRKSSLLTIAILLTVSSAITAGAAAQEWPAGAPWSAWDAVGRADSQVQPVAVWDGDKWLRWVTPLPKRVRLVGKLVVPASDIGPRLRSGAIDVEHTARDKLVGRIGLRLASDVPSLYRA